MFPVSSLHPVRPFSSNVYLLDGWWLPFLFFVFSFYLFKCKVVFFEAQQVCFIVTSNVIQFKIKSHSRFPVTLTDSSCFILSAEPNVRWPQMNISWKYSKPLHVTYCIVPVLIVGGVQVVGVMAVLLWHGSLKSTGRPIKTPRCALPVITTMDAATFAVGNCG